MLSGKNKGSNVNISFVESGDIVTDHQTVSNVFNDYFVDVTADIGKQDSIEEGQTVNDISAVYSNHGSESYVRRNCSAESVMSFNMVCPDVVRKRPSSLNARKATGCDGIPPKLIKLASGVLCNPLCYLINEYFGQSIFPNELKLAQVTPVYKKGDPLVRQNY